MRSTRTKLFNLTRLFGVGSALLVALWLTTAIAAPAQTFNSLVSFDGTNGIEPVYVSLVQGRDGNYYGTTVNGGAYYGERCSDAGCGTVFKITPSGTLTTLYSFCAQTNCADGSSPYAGLVQATNGNFYGMTNSGGANGYGTAFKITATGKLTTLHTFGGTDGAYPYAGLVQGTDGNFYGTTESGGGSGVGTVFKITPAGTLTTLHTFGGTDGAYPYAGLVQGTDGNFYGTTETGQGIYGDGTVYKITPFGKLTYLYSFALKSGADGIAPRAGLVQATDGNFYGTTSAGGANSSGCSGNGCGTIFRITPKGKLTTLYSFCSQSGCTDGGTPYGGVLQATDGTFYGTTYEGGADSSGCNDVGCGTVYSLSMGFGPFVSFVSNSGKVGANVEILGQGFTGTTGVSFNGTAAQFQVVSANYLTATVPNGATTGTVTVTTPGGALNSNVIFRVTPQITGFTPTSGPVGTPVTITGVSLTQTTKVTFGGIAATNFTVNSDTQVTAYVPTGAKTGHIGITTLGGTAVSSGIFTVTQ